VTAAALTGAGNVTTAAVNSGTSLTLTRPTNATTGTVVIAAVFGRNSVAAPSTPPTGWTLLGADSQTSPGWSAIYAKDMTGSEPASYAWAGFATGRLVGIMAVLSGVNSVASLLDVVGAGVTGVTAASTTYTLPSITTTAAGDLVLALVAQNNTSGDTTGITTNAAGFTTVGAAHTTTGASESLLHLAQWTQSSAGATGSQVFTSSATATQSSGEGFMLSLKASGPVVVNANGSGSGTLAATVTPVATVSAPVSGAGTLSDTITPKLTRSAAAAGSGALSAAVTPQLTLACALSGAGTLSTSAANTVAGTLSGSGTLTATVLAGIAGTLSGSGTLTARAIRLGWTFATPTVPVWVRLAGRGLIASYDQALSVWRTGGVWHSKLSPSAADLDGADRYYQGGYQHLIDEITAAELLAAGFTGITSPVVDSSVADLAVADLTVVV
jgi:hypothetical protein